MKRWLKYLLILALLCVMLGIVVPLGLFAHKYSIYNNNPNIPSSDDRYWELNQPLSSGLLPGIVSSIVVFHLVGAILLFVQQYLWFKANKKEQYPVPLKLTKKYMIVGYLCIALIFVNICWSVVAFAAPIYSGTTNKDNCFTRIWVFGGGLIVNAIFTFCIMGYSEYINLQILYNQNVQMVDEGIANGTYDPETRMPYDELNAKNNEINPEDSYEEITIPDLDSKDSVKLSDKDLI